jgi:AdoMet-dependent rRNA methyltransferase SPB1
MTVSPLSCYFDMFFRWLQLEITTSEVRASCEDLKVLGKGDFKNLLRWRTALRQEVSGANLFYLSWSLRFAHRSG